MKHCWLFLALVTLLAAWVEHPWLMFLLGLGLLIFQFRHFHHHMVFCFILFGCLLRMQPPVNQGLPTQDIFVVEEVKSSYVVLKQGGQRVIAYTLQDVHPQDVVQVHGSYEQIDSIHNFDRFYFPAWCHRRGIFYSLQPSDVNVLEEGRNLAHALYVHIQTKPEETRLFLNQMLYGIRMEDSLSFVTSSGLHLITLFYMIKHILTCFLKETTVDVLCFILIGLMAWMTFFSNTILRLLCFRLIQFLFPSMERKDRLGLSILIVLLVAPYMAWELSLLIPIAFQLAVIFQQHRMPKRLQSFLLLIPIQFFVLHQVSILSILFFQLLRYLYALSYGYAWLLCLLPLPATLATKPLHVLAQLLQQEPLLYYVTPLWWLLLYGSYLMRYITLHRRKELVMLFVLLGYTQVHGYLNPFAQIIMLDVGQGDCTLLIYPFQQKVVMVDVMGSLYQDIPKDIIVPILKLYHISAIDILILTHEDMDHSGGKQALYEAVDVKHTIDTKELAALYQGTDLSFLALDYEGSNANENSIITYLSFFDTSLLLMGDAGHEAEKVLLQEYPLLHADVLKAGHHGSKTSTSPAFLHQLHPALTLISAGRNNRYHHPSQEVLDLLEREGSRPLISARSGAIHIQICKFFSFYKTADNEFGIIKIR